ncbi:MAG TPA: glutamate synthase central domain-containing protein, partial [Chloroflexota bacterium]|nr:glutamate synthase central domain-containing protein [Chloroflexota bacterium]
RQQRQFAQIVAEEGQQLLGWRTVPTNNTGLGASALAGEPFIQQVFIQKNNVSGTVGRPATADRGSGRSLTAPEEQLAFERKLFVIRKRAEREIEGKPFYVASLSSRTLVYKGMLLGEQLGDYFPDLHHPDFHSAIALVHSRFSTNTFPSWERAHPYRYVIHNGEINTVQGNVNWLRAREKLFATAAFGDDLPKVLPLIDPDGSDTAMFDNCLEFLALTGRSLPHAVMMMIPEPWEKNEEMCDAKKAFYEFHSHLMEPWDGPASIGFSDGTVVGAVLDRNGLRPSRYTITKDGLVIMASETGVVDIPPENVAHKGRLQPGRMLLVDTAQGRLISDEELKHTLAEEHPYRDWINQHTVDLSDLPKTSDFFEKSDVLKTKKSDVFQSDATLTQQQQAFGYTFEDLRVLMAPMARDGQEAIGSMGDDTPLAILSDKPQPLYNYFKQLF